MRSLNLKHLILLTSLFTLSCSPEAKFQTSSSAASQSQSSPSTAPGSSTSPGPTATPSSSGGTGTTGSSSGTTGSPTCGNQILVGGTCVDFTCSSFTILNTQAELMAIPARGNDGVCYAYKIMSAIGRSSSTLTTTIDTQVISRDHDLLSSDPMLTHHPYSMATFQSQFELLGPRVVKLSGAPSTTTSISIDNFLLMGAYPTASGAPSDLTQAYRVVGTSDSSIANNWGVDTGAILFQNQYIPIDVFASGGSVNVKPSYLSTTAQVLVPQTLDVRALDCGGQRQLSNVYLIFQ